jgi:intracellular sulfur oxidation DsrE/DsrF family protein
MQKALSRAEELMNGPGASANRRVEIVANEGGLDLLRSDVTPFADQIRVLAEQDVLFFACSRAIERLEERGVKVRLVPEADTRYSALDRVVLRMQQGWTYEKI